jgi:hypothetical protein
VARRRYYCRVIYLRTRSNYIGIYRAKSDYNRESCLVGISRVSKARLNYIREGYIAIDYISISFVSKINIRKRCIRKGFIRDIKESFRYTCYIKENSCLS